MSVTRNSPVLGFRPIFEVNAFAVATTPVTLFANELCAKFAKSGTDRRR